MWNLLRLLPLIIGDLIPFDNSVWPLYINFVDIVLRLCASTFSNDDLVVLQAAIDEFLPKYLLCFPHLHLKPKAHYLRHYPDMIRQFGPLVKTLRFEAKNIHILRLS